MKNGLIIDDFGNKRWYVNGKRHKEDGYAVEWTNGTKLWYQNDLCHRLDGPAVEFVNGQKIWYYYGEEIKVSSQEEFERYLKLKLFW